jgi:hypothetical protein
MKKTAKPETKTTATKTATPKTTAPKTALTGTFTYNKDTKRFHAYDLKGAGFNGAIYFEKDMKELPKTLTLTIVSK